MNLPPVGLGTMGIDDPDAVATALAAGYRHPDTARICDNEAVAIAWATAGEPVATTPKASTEEHLRANLAAIDLELTDTEVAAIDAVEREEELFPE